MKISELVKALEEIKKKTGDIDTCFPLALNEQGMQSASINQIMILTTESNPEPILVFGDQPLAEQFKELQKQYETKKSNALKAH